MYPENWEALKVFMAMATQWREVVGDRIVRRGLNYAALPAVLELTGVPKKRRAGVFEGLRTMERAALEVFG